MTSKGNSEVIVIKLGGSLIVPNGGLDVPYIKKFCTFIRKQVAEKNRRFFIFTGGGKLSRHYRDAGAEVTGHALKNEDLDWIGIHVTRLNAHLFRTIFRDIAHPYIVKNYDIIRKATEPIVIAGGWKPGWSTDYDAVILAQDYNIKTIIKMSNTDYIYNKDPRKFKDAKPFKRISWQDYRALVGEKWIPGSSTPFDPIASKLASEIHTKVIYVDGKDISNVEKVMNKEKFLGTTIG